MLKCSTTQLGSRPRYIWVIDQAWWLITSTFKTINWANKKDTKISFQWHFKVKMVKSAHLHCFFRHRDLRSPDFTSPSISTQLNRFEWLKTKTLFALKSKTRNNPAVKTTLSQRDNDNAIAIYFRDHKPPTANLLYLRVLRLTIITYVGWAM